jgi:hypothetical protein
MFITRHALRDAGLDVQLNKQGLSIQGNAQMPEEVMEHVHAITNLMQFTPMDGDRLVEHVASVGIWTALRNCPTEI